MVKAAVVVGVGAVGALGIGIAAAVLGRKSKPAFTITVDGKVPGKVADITPSSTLAVAVAGATPSGAVAILLTRSHELPIPKAHQTTLTTLTADATGMASASISAGTIVAAVQGLKWDVSASVSLLNYWLMAVDMTSGDVTAVFRVHFINSVL